MNNVRLVKLIGRTYIIFCETVSSLVENKSLDKLDKGHFGLKDRLLKH